MADPETINNVLTASLTEVGLTAKEIRRVLPTLNGSRGPPRLVDILTKASQNSRLFHFRQKMETLVERFAASGLDFDRYRQAVVREPQIIYAATDRITRNIAGTVALLGSDGLTERAYVRAALRQPSLFVIRSKTIIANVAAVVDAFHNHGLTTQLYLQAAIRHPPLFYQAPATIAANVRHGSQELAQFEISEGDYLRAGLRYPPLLASAPKTIARHARRIFRLQAQGFIAADCDLRHSLLMTPQFLSLCDANIRLRHVYALVANIRNATFRSLFWPARGQVERAVVGLHELDPAVNTLPPLDAIPYSGCAQRRKHRALLTMTRTGILTSYKPL